MGGTTGHMVTPTPEQRGVPKWQGTPEESFRMVKALIRLMGAQEVGCVELDEKTRKLLYSHNSGNKVIEIEDVDEFYETDTKRVIPEKCRYLVVWAAQCPTQLMRRLPAYVGLSAPKLTYVRNRPLQFLLQEFIRGLGYRAISKGGGDISIMQPYGPLSGIGEHSRMCFVTVSPERGAVARFFWVLTDLPISPTKPIDAGINRFCLTCKICAEGGCPWEALPTGDPSWEPLWDPPIAYSARGFKGWRLNTNRCTFCCGCEAVCPFNGANYASVHELVRATISTTSLLNGFFASMNSTFGYGQEDPETWWELDNEPIFGIPVPWLT